MSNHDVIVVGLGAHGSATLYQLAKRGVDAIGIDRFDPPHEMGSSHGESRGTYEAGAFGSEHHVPFSRRTFQLWRELEDESGEELFTQNGILIMGAEGTDMAKGTLEAASNTGVEFEQLDAAAVHERFPGFSPDDDVISIFQPKGGLVRVAEILGAQLRLAAERGATIRTNEPVTSWTATDSGVEVTTSRDTYRAEKLVFSAGPYLPGLVPDLPVQINPERQVLVWWTPRANAENFGPDKLPVWVLENRTHDVVFGVPDLGTGVKTGVHYEGTVTDPETVNRTVEEADIRPMRDLIETIQPDALGEFRRGVVCLYTCTPDYEFIVDTHPAHENVLIACICNSQGFKYSAAFGETLASLAIDGQAELDVSPWSFDRFMATK